MRRLPLAPLLGAVLLLAGCAATPRETASTGRAGAAAAFNVLGREDAPVTIIEFTDLQCPYCARHARQTFPALRRDYIDTGKLRYASRDLPLPFHRFALPAAVAARCAGEQGRFWEYRDALFAAQQALPSAPYARIAQDLGLDVAQLEACRNEDRQAAEVRADIERAQANGIRSTPSFVIGRVVNGEFRGEAFSGARPYEDFKDRIEALLRASD